MSGTIGAGPSPAIPIFNLDYWHAFHQAVEVQYTPVSSTVGIDLLAFWANADDDDDAQEAELCSASVSGIEDITFAVGAPTLDDIPRGSEASGAEQTGDGQS